MNMKKGNAGKSVSTQVKSVKAPAKKSAAKKSATKESVVKKPTASKKTSQKTSTLTEVVFILDRSGSMARLERATINGFNALIRQQLKEKGDVIVSTVLFDSTIHVLHDRIDIHKVDKMTKRDYSVGGQTALLDAIGGAIDHIGRIHKRSPRAALPQQTMFVIITDGKENASTKYTFRRVKDLIENQKKKFEWDFVFMGANIDAVATASDIGINAKQAVNYHCDSRGLGRVYDALSRRMYCMYEGGNRNDMSWRADVDKDFNAR